MKYETGERCLAAGAAHQMEND